MIRAGEVLARRAASCRSSTRSIATSPSASCVAVSTDCQSRVRRSGFITSRSTTTSIVCLNFLSRTISSSSSCCSPSTFTRVKPSRRSSSKHVRELALAVADDRRVDGEARPLGQREDLVDDRLEALAGDRPAADRAVRPPDARVEQAQVVVDLGDGADGRARVPRRRLLVDRDRRREAVDRVDVRLLHHLEELPRVRRERLDVAALPLRVDRVEGQARLAGAREAGDADQLVPRQRDRDVLEVVLPRAVDDELFGSHDRASLPSDGRGTLLVVAREFPSTEGGDRPGVRRFTEQASDDTRRPDEPAAHADPAPHCGFD